MSSLPILSITILIPLLSAIFIILFVRSNRHERGSVFLKYVAMLSSILTLFCSIYLVVRYDSGLNAHEHKYQFEEYYHSLGIHLGIDGVSLFFIVLTSILTILCMMVSLSSVQRKVKEFFACFLLLESLTIATFCALNMLLFYCCFEAMLVPMYFIIGIWGGENKVYAAMKFFLYTLAGSIFFLVAIVFLYLEFGTLEMDALAGLCTELSVRTQKFLWLAAFIAFAVKVPMFPVHTWLPDAHVQAPTGGSVVLAGILLKVGTYGMLRVCIGIFPDASMYFSDVVMILSIIAVIYASFVAMYQRDMKKTIAYSSIAHMGYVTGGLFSFTYEGIMGSILQMLSHGFISAGLFMVVGMLYERMHTKQISAYGGVAYRMPKLAALFALLTFGSVGLPGTTGFVGEFATMIGVFKMNYLYGALMVTGVVFGAIYMLRLYRDVMLGEIKHAEVNELQDISKREILCLLPLVLLMLYYGIFSDNIIQYFAHESEYYAGIVIK